MSQNLSSPRNIILFLAIAAVLLTLIYQNSITFEKTQASIRIGITQWPGFEYLFITKKMGFFEQANINVELIELSSLAEVRRAYSRGKVDGMAATLVEVLEAYKYSNKIAKPILVIDYSKGSDEILATNNIKFIEQLKGKKIGVEAGSLSSYLVNNALKLNNIKQSDVVIVPMPLNKLSRALKSGKVDAITSHPPESIKIKKQLDVNVLFDSSELPENILDVIAIDQEVLDKFPAIQNQMNTAWNLTLSYVNEFPKESYDTLTERIPISVSEFKQAMQKIKLVNAEEQNFYFSGNKMLENYLITTGDIIFKKPQNEIDYSIFLHQSHAQ